MNKILTLFLSLAICTNIFAQGDPSPFIKGQSSTGLGNQASTIFVPYNQSTKLNAYQALVETGNENMFINGGFEGLGTSGVANGWTNGSGTATLTRTSGEFSSGKQAQKIVLSTQTLNFSQTVLTPAGIQKQGVVGIVYRLPSAASSGVRICSLVDGNEQKCVDGTNSLITDDAFHSIEIPVVFGATSAGIAIKSIGAFSATVYFDAAYIKQGIGFQNLQGDTVYSALINSTSGAVSNENVDFINGNCSVASNVATCTYKSGLVTGYMNCIGSVSPNAGDGFIEFTASTSTSFSFRARNDTGVLVGRETTIHCQKTGTDYLAASSSAYVASNANYDWTAYTPTFVGLGTVTVTESFQTRVGGNLFIKGRATLGTTTGVGATIGLPSGLNVSSTFETSTALVNASIVNNSNTGKFSGLITGAGTSVALGNIDSSGLSNVIGTTVGSSGNAISWAIGPIPIEGWTNSNIIVGSFAGYGKAPGLDGSATPNLDIFKVSYGATATTDCTTGTCAYIDVIGGSGATVSVSGTTYTFTTARTYAKLKCEISAVQAGASRVQGLINAANTNTATFTTASGGGAAVNSFGTIYCMGSY